MLDMYCLGYCFVAEEYRNSVETASTVTIFTDNEKYLENPCRLSPQDFKQVHVNVTKYWEIL